MHFAATLVGFASIVAALPAASSDVHLSKRIFIPADECGSTSDDLEDAANACYALATAAAKDARGGSGSSSRMQKFFKADDDQTRTTVANGYDLIAQECISNSGKSGFRCVDLTGQCKGTIYGYQTGTAIVICNPFYEWPLDNTECNANTQASNLVHEISHLDSTVASSDYNGCYGLECSLGLPASSNIKHADTYRLYAQAVHSNCY